MVTRTKLSYLYSIAVSAMLIFAAAIASSFLSFTGGDAERFASELYSNAFILALIGVIALVAAVSLGFSSVLTQLERMGASIDSRLDAISQRLESAEKGQAPHKKD